MLKKTTYQRQHRSAQELNKICGDAFRAVILPEHWKFKEYERVPLDPNVEPEEIEIQAIAAVFIDKRTSGLNLKHYRMNFHTYSERLSIVQISFQEYGKQSFSCLISNKTPEQINEFITDNLN